MRKTKKGFTLIELLVVIAIIGLLASIVLVALNTARAKARDSRAMSDLRQIATALEMDYDDNQEYLALGAAAHAITDGESAVGIGVYLKPVPQKSKNAYWWYNPSGVTDPTDFCVYVDLEKNNPDDYFYVSEKGAGGNSAADCP